MKQQTGNGFSATDRLWVVRIKRVQLYLAALAIGLVAAGTSLAAIVDQDVDLAAIEAASVNAKSQTPIQVLIQLQNAGASPTAKSILTLERDLADSNWSIIQRAESLGLIAALISAEDLERLRVHPNVLRIGLDSGGSTQLRQAKPLANFTALENMGLTGAGMTVAVIDSGIDTDHPAFAGRIVAQQCFCTTCCPNGQATQSGPGAAEDGGAVANPPNPAGERVLHGTTVAAIMAGANADSTRAGVAPAAEIIAVKVTNDAGNFQTTLDIIAGLDWVSTNHPEVDVINMSLATSTLVTGNCSGTLISDSLATTLANLKSRNILVTASSGNTGSDTQMAAPACVADAVSVAAVWDQNVNQPITVLGCTQNPAVDLLTCWSNISTTTDLLAPGGFYSFIPGNPSDRSTVGTSFAAPLAGGCALLLKQAFPAATYDQVLTALKSTGKSVSGRGQTIPRIDCAAARVALASNTTSSALTVTRAGAGSGTVTSLPAGIQCGATCNASFTTGTLVTLSAAADAGSAFDGWSGDCNAGGQVTLATDRSCTATFSASPTAQTLTVTLAGNGFGSVISVPGLIDCGLTCMDSFATGTSVTLIATEVVGSLVAGWTGDCDANGRVTMSTDRSCTATFIVWPTTQTLTINLTGNGSGTVSSSPAGIDCGVDCSEAFDTGTIVTLTQVAAPGSTANGFTGPADCADGQVTMNADLACSAVFEINLASKLRVEPAILDFVGYLTRPLTIFNDGPGELEVKVISIECLPGACVNPFSVDPPLGTIHFISPGSTDSIDVTFDPFNVSYPAEHWLVLESNDPTAAVIEVPMFWINDTLFEAGFEDIGATPAPLYSSLTGLSGLQVGEMSQWNAETIGVDQNPIVFDYIWESSDPSVATVSDSGLVTGISLGSSLISVVGAKPGTTVVAIQRELEVVGPPVNIVVTSSIDRLKFGETFLFEIEIRDANDNMVNADFTWSSSDTAVATVGETGLVTAVDAGNTGIEVTATTFAGAILSAHLILIVEGPPIRLAFLSQVSTLQVGQTFQFIAQAYDAINNPVDADVSWTTSNSTIASVDDTGLVTALDTGNVSIGVATARFGATTPLTVIPPQVIFNQPPNFASGAPSDEDIGSLGQHYADNFVVQDPSGQLTISQIEFWGIYFHTGTPQGVDDFNIYVREQVAGLPFTGVPLLEEIGAAVPRTLTGSNTTTSQGSAATYKYVFTLPTPVTLPNGTYWIEIFNDTRSDGDDNWAWVRANQDPSNGLSGEAFHGRFTAWQSVLSGDQAVIIYGFVP